MVLWWGCCCVGKARGNPEGGEDASASSFVFELLPSPFPSPSAVGGSGHARRLAQLFYASFETWLPCADNSR